jgi:hypothetical protein
MRWFMLPLLVGCGGKTADDGDVSLSESSLDSADADADADSDSDTDADADSDSDTDTDVTGCYPDGAVEPMAEGEVLTAYSWPDARHLDGRTASLELSKVPCSDDDDIDWSPHDVLVFVSIPAW